MAKSTLPSRRKRNTVTDEKKALAFLDGAASQQVDTEESRPIVPKAKKKKGVLLNLYTDEIETIDELAQAREPRPISRTAWILEAIAEKIKREQMG